MDCQLKIMPWFDRCVNFGQRLASLRAHNLIDMLLPDQCRLCGAASDNAGYCSACAAGLPRHGCQCPCCGIPVTVAAMCGRCQRYPPPILETIAPFQHTASVRDDIHQLKYRQKLACGRDLGFLLAREVEQQASWLPEVLVPVPLHWKRRLGRGFNQSVEIARPVSRALGIPINLSLITRQIHTAPQVRLASAQRRRNIRRAFQTTHQPVPASAAIIDDVITSGSTATEVARCLRAAGVQHVVAWALARV